MLYYFMFLSGKILVLWGYCWPNVCISYHFYKIVSWKADNITLRGAQVFRSWGSTSWETHSTLCEDTRKGLKTTTQKGAVTRTPGRWHPNRKIPDSITVRNKCWCWSDPKPVIVCASNPNWLRQELPGKGEREQERLLKLLKPTKYRVLTLYF